jgi:hypothetical protein
MEKFKLNPNRRFIRAGMAHDDAEEYPSGEEHFPGGGIKRLAQWCRKNLRHADLEELKKELEGEISNRLTSVITADSARVMTPERRKLEANFARVFGPAVRNMTDPRPPVRPVDPQRMKKAGETLAAALGGLAPNKVL